LGFRCSIAPLAGSLGPISHAGTIRTFFFMIEYCCLHTEFVDYLTSVRNR
jgi:hypothetical protein